MMADTPDELHAMVDKLGISRRHYHDGHYNVCASKRELAIENGATAVSSRDLVELRRSQRVEQ